MKNSPNSIPSIKTNRILPLLFCCFLAPVVAANAATACVWKVTNAKAPCYLVGTIHSLSGNDYPLPKAYDQVYHEVNRLVFEINFDPQGDYNRKFDKACVYPKGDGIQRHVHPKMWKIITTNFSNHNMLGIDAKLGDVYLEHGIQQLRPWALAYIFYGIPGYSDEFVYYGVDSEWMRHGRREGKDLAGLETDEEHIDVLRGMNDIESEGILIYDIAYRDKQRPEFNEIKSAWKRGDTATLWKLSQRFRNTVPGADIRLLDMRNVKWVPKIRNEFNSGVPTAIVVGAGHMLGPNGLVSLLERNGFKFEQL